MRLYEEKKRYDSLSLITSLTEMLKLQIDHVITSKSAVNEADKKAMFEIVEKIKTIADTGVKLDVLTKLGGIIVCICRAVTGNVWAAVAQPGAAKIVVLNPENAEVVATIKTTSTPLCMCAVPGAIWVGTKDNVIHVYDSESPFIPPRLIAGHDRGPVTALCSLNTIGSAGILSGNINTRPPSMRFAAPAGSPSPIPQDTDATATTTSYKPAPAPAPSSSKVTTSPTTVPATTTTEHMPLGRTTSAMTLGPPPPATASSSQNANNSLSAIYANSPSSIVRFVFNFFMRACMHIAHTTACTCTHLIFHFMHTHTLTFSYILFFNVFLVDVNLQDRLHCLQVTRCGPQLRTLKLKFGTLLYAL